MSYIGRGVDAISNVEKLTNINFDGSTTYNLVKDGVAFTPSGANNILISIDGVIQQGNFTVANATIIFDFSVSANSTCNFIMHYGVGVLNISADDSISTAKLQNDSVTTDKLANSINTAITANTAKTGITSSQTSAITANTSKTTNATHSGEVTGATALTIADNIVDEANLKVSNTPTNGYALTAQSSNTGGMTWASVGGGKVLQVLHKKLTSNYSMSSGTTTDVTGLSQAITMASSSNHLLVLGNYCFRVAGNGATASPSSNTFITNSSNALLAGSYFLLYLSNNNHNPTWTANQCAYFTPATTDAYTVKVRTNNASEGGLVQFYGSNNNSYSTNLTLIEIAA